MGNERNAVPSADAVRVRRCSSAMLDVSPTVDCTFDRQVNQQIATGGGLSSPCGRPSERTASSFNFEMWNGLKEEYADTLMVCNIVRAMVYVRGRRSPSTSSRGAEW